MVKKGLKNGKKVKKLKTVKNGKKVLKNAQKCEKNYKKLWYKNLLKNYC